VRQKLLDREKRLLILGITLGVVLPIVVLFLPVIPTKEIRNEIEPYERDAKYEVVSATVESNWGWEPWAGLDYYVSTVIVKNIDNFDATFSVTHNIYYNPASRQDINPDEKILYVEKVVSEHILSGQTKSSTFTFDYIDEGQTGHPADYYLLEYTVTPSTVIDQQVVTKQRIAYRSIIEILMQG